MPKLFTIRKYLWLDEMAVGDSVEIQIERSVLNSIYRSAQKRGIKICGRKLGPEGYRFWRVA